MTTQVTKLHNSKFAYEFTKHNADHNVAQTMSNYLRGQNIPCLINLDTGTRKCTVRVFKAKNQARREASIRLYQTLLKRQQQQTEVQTVDTPQTETVDTQQAQVVNCNLAKVHVNEDHFTVTVNDESHFFWKPLEDTEHYITFERGSEIFYIAKDKEGQEDAFVWCYDNEVDNKTGLFGEGGRVIFCELDGVITDEDMELPETFDTSNLVKVQVNPDDSFTVIGSGINQTFQNALEDDWHYITFERYEEVIYIAKDAAGVENKSVWCYDNAVDEETGVCQEGGRAIFCQLDGDITHYEDEDPFPQESITSTSRVLSGSELMSFKKDELQALCRLTDTHYNRRDNKTKLSIRLDGLVNSTHIQTLHAQRQA